MTQHLDYLDAGAFEERLLTKEEIIQRMNDWKAQKKEEPVEEDDTQPFSAEQKAEVALVGKLIAILRETKMKAGYFCEQPEVKAAIDQMKHEVRDKIEQERILSDFFVNNNHLFS